MTYTGVQPSYSPNPNSNLFLLLPITWKRYSIYAYTFFSCLLMHGQHIQLQYTVDRRFLIGRHCRISVCGFNHWSDDWLETTVKLWEALRDCVLTCSPSHCFSDTDIATWSICWHRCLSDTFFSPSALSVLVYSMLHKVRFNIWV